MQAASASRNMVSAALRRGLDVVLPPQCVVCARPVEKASGLCPACFRRMPFIERPYCERLGTPFDEDLGERTLSPAAVAAPPAFGRARAVARFEGPARDLVHRLKYGDRTDLGPLLGRWMARAGAEILDGADALVPVPLHWRRLWGRRFNQAALLAGGMASACGAPVAVDVLRRGKPTRSQVGLSASERARNLQGALQVPEAERIRVKGRALVLVDDVMTTGATANAAARVLLRAGAARVDVMLFALVV